MKQIKLSLIALGISTAGFFAFTSIDTGSIKGKVSPADGAVQAWAISATDTLKAPIANGAFEIPGAKAGTYKLVIEAKPPYKNAAKEGISVLDGQATVVAEITLVK
ncbi:carboxypeptidase-like regulatory domain-containing protein [Flavihumibacter profundi]|uniref:carboxypeptidase-like regulatory domain-containing protein n=1 Tax=Flavihumibacter profundi TaxID=2716883 RepID=UPI001CC486D8|nr:carboxypeptidase-like regulatory domain-containing protein [Flavihumibacter profundi]MBZ5859015.1 carboxypeptidase-like regulatory domain-containing protein [Flavihumibacter profundi]